MQTHNIHNLMNEIRAFVNEPRRKNILYFESGKFDQLIACLDVIEDCEEAIISYKNMKGFRSNIGIGYLSIYGLLQSFIMQQDAVKYLSTSLLDKEIKLTSDFPSLKKIRRLRNETVGHPVQNNYGVFTQIVRMELTPKSIVVNYHRKEGFESKDIDIYNLITDQNKSIGKALSTMIDDLRKDEEKHKNMFRSDPLSNIIPEWMSYGFEKIIAVNDIDQVDNAKAYINEIEDVYNAIDAKIKERDKYVKETDPYDYITERLEFSINRYKQLIASYESFHEFNIYGKFIYDKFTALITYCKSTDEYYDEED